MRRMLFNATQPEELRVAIVDGQKLIDLDIELAGKEERKGNIYKGIITRIEPSLEAAFVNYGSERHGFLPFKEVSRVYFLNQSIDVSRARIQDVLREGQEFVVQVEKEERGTKGAVLTTFISLAGRYLVLMPNNPRGGGVSRRIEGEERNELRDVMAQLDVPQGMSIIARTAGIGRTVEELNWDLNYLMQLWRAIENAADQQKAPFLIYQESSLVIRAIRDYFQREIGEILIDTENIFHQAQQFMSHVMPNNVSRVKLYKDDVPLFSRFQIEHQIETAYSREVVLPSGGAIVIDHTEALVSIDVNSARATRGSDIEQTALNTNLEAAEEAARQLRLRDLGGLIVIDFIDMENNRNQRDVENRLREALHYDRARVQMGKISRFGLLELSRQRLRPSLGETSHVSCPRCNGTGHIRGIESSALHILRIIQEEAMKENSAAVHVQVPVDVGTFLLNEKRSDIHNIEARFKVNIVLIPNTHLETPNYTITRLREEEMTQQATPTASYEMVEMPAEEAVEKAQIKEPLPPRPEAAVKGITPQQPAPIVEETKPSLFGKFFGWLVGNEAVTKEESPTPTRSETVKRDRQDGPRERQQRRGRGEGDSRNTRRGGERSERRETRRPPRDRGERDLVPQNAAERNETSEPEQKLPELAKPMRSESGREPGRESGEGRSKRRRGKRERGERRSDASTQDRGEHRLDSPHADKDDKNHGTEEITAHYTVPTSVTPTPVIEEHRPSEEIAKPEHVPYDRPESVVHSAVDEIQVDVSNSEPRRVEGLTMIETDPNKVKTPVVETEAEAVPTSRTRPRIQQLMESNEILEQVETNK